MFRRRSARLEEKEMIANLLFHRRPVKAIVFAFGLDERAARKQNH
jgi:hypothetical protein